MQFTIITPTYNRADCIKDCIESVAAQLADYKDFEQIIIDDGSTDGTFQIIEESKQAYGFIKTIGCDINRGVNHARNRGIEKASGNFIIFLDSDDTLNPGILKKIDDVIKDNGSVSHFLFKVSTNNLLSNAITEITYKDLLLEKLHGDYLHIVKASFLKENLFFEQFKAFEHLNWLRVIRNTQPLLAIPVQAVTVKIRDNDSLSQKMYKSTKRNVLLENFEAQKLYLSLYSSDLKGLSQKAYYKKVVMLFVMGLRANLYTKNNIVIKDHIPFKLLQKLIILFFNNRLLSISIRSVYSIKYIIR